MSNTTAFARQFVVFLSVLNLGILCALGWVFLKVDAQRSALEAKETQIIRDNVHYRDSLRRDTLFLKSIMPRNVAAGPVVQKP
jgi:hypothetical protein